MKNVTTIQRGWHPEDIKAAIRRSGLSLGGLAARVDLAPSTIQAALRRPQPSGNRAIADHLGVELHVLWPQFYDCSGRLRPTAYKSIRVAAPAHRQRVGAA